MRITLIFDTDDYSHNKMEKHIKNTSTKDLINILYFIDELRQKIKDEIFLRVDK